MTIDCAMDSVKTPALLPCPCGGEAQQNFTVNHSPGCGFIKCTSCGIRTDVEIMPAAVAKWNRRAASPPTGAEVVAWASRDTIETLRQFGSAGSVLLTPTAGDGNDMPLYADFARLRSEKAERPVVSVSDEEISIEWRGKVLLSIDKDGVSYAIYNSAWLPGSFDTHEDWIEALGEIRRALSTPPAGAAALNEREEPK